MKQFFKKDTRFLSMLGVIVVGILLVHIMQSVSALESEPGTEGDPVVSQSYVDRKISELEKKIEELKAGQVASQTAVEVVELKIGQTIIGGAGSQFVLRGGTAKAINGAGGGLGDLTSGSSYDIKNNGSVPVNHLLLIPRDDGRGLKITSAKAWVLVMGKYTVN